MVCGHSKLNRNIKEKRENLQIIINQDTRVRSACFRQPKCSIWVLYNGTGSRQLYKVTYLCPGPSWGWTTVSGATCWAQSQIRFQGQTNSAPLHSSWPSARNEMKCVKVITVLYSVYLFILGTIWCWRSL